MRKIILLLVIFLCMGSLAHAQEISWREMTLSELGWEKDLILEGSNPSHSLYLPNFPGVDWSASALYLKVKTSPLLNPASTLSLYGDGNLLFSTSLPQGEKTFRIPLAELSPNEKLHRLEIRASLAISDNLCEDLASGQLFLTVHKESTLSLVFQKTRLTALEEFLTVPDSQIDIVFPAENWSRELQTAYIELYAFLSRFYRNMPVKINTVSPPLPKTLVENRRRIFLTERRGRDFELYGPNLYLTPQGVKAILHHPQILSFASSTIEPIALSPTILERKLSLAQLGATQLSFKGIGTLSETLYFASADLGGIPQTLTLTLYYNTILPRQEAYGEASLRVKLNGMLVWVEKISARHHSPLTSRVIPISPFLLRRENALEITCTYFPEIGNCRRGEAPLEVTISGDSYLETKGEGPKPPLLTWNDVPTFFWGKGFIVLPETPTLEELVIAAQIASSLRAIDRTPIDFEVISHQKAQEKLRRPPQQPYSHNLPLAPWQELLLLPRSAIDYAHSLPQYSERITDQIVALTTFLLEKYLAILKDLVLYPLIPFITVEQKPALAYFIFIAPQGKLATPPLLPQKGELVVQSLEDQREVMRFAPDEPLSFLTLFWENRHPVILFSPYGNKDIAYAHFLELFQREKTLRRLTGNVTLFGRKGMTDLLLGQHFRWKGETPRFWQEIYYRYRLMVFLVGACVIILLAGWWYSRLTQPPMR